MAKICLAIIAVFAWLGLALQFWLVAKDQQGIAAMLTWIVNFFSYFTILTNLLIALATTLPLLGTGKFFERTDVRTAIAVYSTVTSIIYITILSDLWNPQGLAWVADTVLHKVTPVLFVLYWLLFVPKGGLRWQLALALLVFPFVYGLWTLIHGPLSGFYPYPFIDMSKLGLPRTLANMGGMTLFFLILGLAFVGIDRLLGRRAA